MLIPRGVPYMRQARQAETPLFNIGQRQPDMQILITLTGLILLASLLRLSNLGERSLWYDEAASVRNVRIILSLPPYEDHGLIGLLRTDRLPALYFLFLVPFCQLSQSEWVMRLASFMWGVATVPLMYALGARLCNKG